MTYDMKRCSSEAHRRCNIHGSTRGGDALKTFQFKFLCKVSIEKYGFESVPLQVLVRHMKSCYELSRLDHFMWL